MQEIKVLFIGDYRLYRRLRPLDTIEDKDSGMVEALTGAPTHSSIWVDTWSHGKFVRSKNLESVRTSSEVFEQTLASAFKHASGVNVICLLGDSYALNAINIAKVFFQEPHFAVPFRSKPFIFVAEKTYEQQVAVLQGLEGFEKCELWDSSSKKTDAKLFETKICELQGIDPSAKPQPTKLTEEQKRSEELRRVISERKAARDTAQRRAQLLSTNSQCSLFRPTIPKIAIAGTVALGTGVAAGLGAAGILSIFPPAAIIALGVISAVACLALLLMAINQCCQMRPQRQSFVV